MPLGTKVVLLAASSLTTMAAAILSPALPAIQQAFAGRDDAELLVRLMLTMPALSVIVTAPVSGWLADRVGRKPVLMGGLVLYAVAGTSGLALDTLEGLLAGRAALGVATGALITSATTLIADELQGAARTRFLGAQAAAMALGGLVYLLAGGLLADVGWRAPFAVYGASLLFLPLAALWIREPERTRGAAPGPATPGDEPSRPATAGFVAMVAAVGFTGMLLFYLVPVQLPFALADRLDASGAVMGLVIGGVAVTSAMTSLTFRAIHARIGHGGAAAATLGLTGLGLLLLAPGDGGYGLVMLAMALVGLGTGLLLPNLNTWMTSRAPAARRGRLVGVLNTAIFLGQFSSPLVAAPLVAGYGTDGLGGLFGLTGSAALALGLLAALLSARSTRAT